MQRWEREVSAGMFGREDVDEEVDGEGEGGCVECWPDRFMSERRGLARAMAERREAV